MTGRKLPLFLPLFLCMRARLLLPPREFLGSEDDGLERPGFRVLRLGGFRLLPGIAGIFDSGGLREGGVLGSVPKRPLRRIVWLEKSCGLVFAFGASARVKR